MLRDRIEPKGKAKDCSADLDQIWNCTNWGLSLKKQKLGATNREQALHLQASRVGPALLSLAKYSADKHAIPTMLDSNPNKKPLASHFRASLAWTSPKAVPSTWRAPYPPQLEVGHEGSLVPSPRGDQLQRPTQPFVFQGPAKEGLFQPLGLNSNKSAEDLPFSEDHRTGPRPAKGWLPDVPPPKGRGLGKRGTKRPATGGCDSYRLGFDWELKYLGWCTFQK